MCIRDSLEARGSFVNPSYDPRQSRLGWRDFWLCLRDDEGQAIACTAEKVVDTEDLLEDIATGRVWYEHGFAQMGGPDRIDVLRGSMPIRGVVSHSGSTWVDAPWRRHGLALLLTRLSRALSFRNYGAVVNTGFVRQKLYETSVPKESYGYVHVELCIDGYFPPQGGPERLYLCWIDDTEFVDSILELPRHRLCPVPLVGRPVERSLSLVEG